jgi:serine/threonine-protein kinase
MEILRHLARVFRNNPGTRRAIVAGLPSNLERLPSMSELTAEQFTQRAFDLDLLDERCRREIYNEIGGSDVPLEELTQFLLRRNFLTPYQLDRLMKGETGGFYYGRNKILYFVGSGTFARVYRAVNQQNSQVVAVKVLRQRFSNEPEKVESFRREGEVGASLRHPNIVSVYEVASQRGSHYMAMEFIEGPNLRDFLKLRTKLDPLSATRLATDVARGLDHAFRRGISHRDMKASNVLVSSTGQAKLVDFGLAGADPDLSDEALADLDNPRTIDYAALERATGVRKDDARSDIYFLGCIYYNMLTGVPALQETRDRLQRLSKSRFTSVIPIGEIAPHVPKIVVKVVMKSMELEPNLRYQSPGEFLNDLTALQLRLKENAGDVESLTDLSAGPVFKQRTVMVVASNTQLQDKFRDLFKRNGYRVLVTSDPHRPSNSFHDTQQPADCVVYSTADLGTEALDSFNRFGEDTVTRETPAILLLDPKHQSWAARANTADHRVTLRTPLKLRELRAVLDRLVPRQFEQEKRA